MSEKYLIDGTKVEVQETLKMGFLVRVVYESGEDDHFSTHLGNPIIVQAVFDSPPREIVDKAIRELEEKKMKLSEEISGLNKEKAAKLREVEEINKKFSYVPQLARLQDFIDGKITHFVVIGKYDNWDVTILEVGKTSRHDDNRIELMKLFGGSNGKLTWEMTYKKDYYNTEKENVIPVFSREEALKVAENLIMDKMKVCPSQDYVDNAKKLGIEVPQIYIDRIRQMDIEIAEKEYERSKRYMEDSAAKLEKLKEGKL